MPPPAIPGPWPHRRVEGRELRLHGDAFEVSAPATWEHLVDPRLPERARAWGLGTPAGVDAFRRWDLRAGRVVQVSLHHSWAAAAWARAGLRGATVVHLDRHSDCGAPLLLADRAGALLNCLTGAPLGADGPAGFEAAAASGAMGVGGFIAPAVAAGIVGRVLHVLPPRTPLPAPRERALVISAGEPHPRRPDLRWLVASLGDAPPGPALATAPCVSAHPGDLAGLAAGLPGPIVIDVDLDYASNRYRGDPDWEGAPGAEQSPEAFAADVDAVLAELAPASIACVTVAASPGYCPVEAWRPLVEALSAALELRLGVSLDGLGPWPAG